MTNLKPTARRVERVVTTDPPVPGFGGAGHTAVLVLGPERFREQDPFILLADDRLDLPDGAALGGEHPHAGFEIATFALEGSLNEGDEGMLSAGDVLWTTAGRGIIHGERAIPQGPTRILQLWFVLPERDRWTEPSFQLTRRADAPVRREPGIEARVYSGRSGDARAERREHTPITMVDFTLSANAPVEQELPASYNGFLYVITGDLRVGDDRQMGRGQVGWLDRPGTEGSSTLQLTGGSAGARVVLYAGQPQHFAIESHGPFVGGSRADLMRMSREYLAGSYKRMSELVAEG